MTLSGNTFYKMETNKAKKKPSPSKGTIRKQLLHLLCFVFKCFGKCWSLGQSFKSNINREWDENVDKCLKKFQWDSL